jgi:hypothetical protein
MEKALKINIINREREKKNLPTILLSKIKVLKSEYFNIEYGKHYNEGVLNGYSRIFSLVWCYSVCMLTT